MSTNTPVEQQRRSHETPVVGEWCWLTTEVTEAGAVLDGPGSVWIHAGCFSIVLTITQLVLTSSSCKQQQLWLLHVLYVILTACLDVTCLVCHLSSTCYLFYVIYQSLHVTCRMSSNLSSCKLNPSSCKWQEYWVGKSELRFPLFVAVVDSSMCHPALCHVLHTATQSQRCFTFHITWVDSGFV